MTQGAAALTLSAQFETEFVLTDDSPGALQPSYTQSLPVQIEVVTNLTTVDYRLTWDFQDVMFTPGDSSNPLFVSSSGGIVPEGELSVVNENPIWVYLDGRPVVYSGGWTIRSGSVEGAVVSEAQPGAISQPTGSYTNLVFDSSSGNPTISLQEFVPRLAQPISTTDGDYTLSIDLTDPYFLLNTVLSGDMNSDGQVDAADYTVWRDADGPLKDRLTSYDDWRSNYGGQLPSAAAASSAPEPAAAGLLAVGLLASLRRRRRIG